MGVCFGFIETALPIGDSSIWVVMVMASFRLLEHKNIKDGRLERNKIEIYFKNLKLAVFSNPYYYAFGFNDDGYLGCRSFGWWYGSFRKASFVLFARESLAAVFMGSDAGGGRC